MRIKKLKRLEAFEKTLSGFESSEREPVPQTAVQAVHRQSTNTSRRRGVSTCDGGIWDSGCLWPTDLRQITNGVDN